MNDETNDPFGDGIPEEYLWNPEMQCYMQRSLFDGQWQPRRNSLWEAGDPAFQYDPERDRTYQDAMRK